ncbi:MAG: hypothetical protein ACTH1Z_02770 [Ancrocorticia sp.]|uniref:hypothetical protein n=1 Tax=Ancrocorticia sp. TaxID=2593684 RepID=UPI003F903EFA
MIERIDQGQAIWFSQWLRGSMGILPEGYARRVGILPSGTVPVPGAEVPFQAPDCNDDPPSDAQQEVIDHILLESIDPETPCCFAVYAYFPRQDWGVHYGFNQPEGTWYLAGDLHYVMFSAPLKEGLFGPIAQRWGDVFSIELSYLWPEDRSWFLSSPLDVAFATVGSDDDLLADKLLAQPILDAHEW